MILKQAILICCISGFIGLKANTQPLVPNFSSNVVSGCGPLAVFFKDLSTGAPIYWEWDFGNGQISSLQNPAATYANPGVYTVTLIVRNAGGANSIRKTNYITVYPYPLASFTSSQQQGVGCAPVNVQFTDKSTPGQGSVTAWSWNFGDGGSSNLPNPTHTYTQTGYYTVGLTVTNSQGCQNTASVPRYLRIIPGVQINFAWTQTSASCSAPYSLTFMNQTSGPGNLTYSWDLGNGNTSTAANPSTVYPANKNYTVTLKAVSDLGCSSDSQEVVSLSSGNALINAPDSACINTPVNFINGSSPPPLSVYWDFGDGTNSVSASPTKTYGAFTTYKVKLINTYAACTDSTTKLLKIVNNPIANFTAIKTASCQSPFTVNFQDASTGGATAWQWDFGDGNTSTLQNPSNTYTSSGSYDVTLTVTHGVGCSATITKSKFIQINAPSAILVPATAGACVGSPVTLAASVNAVDGLGPNPYSWSAPGANLPNTSNSPTPSFTYPATGYYDITLTVTTKDGCSFTNTFTSAVLVGNPVTPDIHAMPTTVCARQPITFSTTTTPANNLTWNFGDGTYGTTNPILHTYSDTGSFNISLTNNNGGCAKTASLSIRVNPPIANFTFSVNCVNKLSVQVSDSSKIDPAGNPVYQWYFGDNSPIVTGLTPPPHTYPAYGNYTITLTVMNSGCTDSIKKAVYLTALIPSFSPSSNPVCRNAPLTLNSTTTDANGGPLIITGIWWKVGTGPYNPAGISYLTSIGVNGNIPVSIKVRDVNGCSDSSAITASSYITVSGPTAMFTPVGAGGCKNSPIIFTDGSTPDPPTVAIKTWTWDFGDGTVTTFTSGPFSHQYADTGSYPVKLTVTDANTCSDTYQSIGNFQITSPQPGFYAKDTVYCPNAQLPFTDTSIGRIQIYSWDFGDGATSNLPNPSHAFGIIGNHYSIKLKLTDLFGCTDSLTRTNYINIENPIPAFTMTDSIGICYPLQTDFTPNAQFYDSLYWDFGDGTTSTLPNTTHFYNGYGTFPVSLVLKGAGGCIDSATQRVQVLDPKTTTTFTYSPVKNCDSVRANFTILPPPDTRFTIMFGDGKADSSENGSLNHLYNTPNTYSPQLLLQDSSGCIVPLGGYSTITVLGAVPFFSMDKKAFCDGGTVNFTDFTITNDAPIQETWNFGDGQTSTQNNPTHIYTTPGIHLASLQVTTANNCMENYTDTVHIWQTPHPLIAVTTPYCMNSPVAMQGSLVTPDVDSVSWSWNFGDGQSSSLQNPSVSYAKPGQYKINLRASVAFGCSDSTSYNLVVNPLPSVKGPKVINTPVGIPVTIPFTYSSNVVSYSWTPDSNLSCTTCPNPIANPTFATLYIVTVTDTSNCSFTDSILVNTICNDKNYFVPNTFSPNGDGVNDVFYPRGSNLYNVQSMRIFNRWGQMVFERRDFPANSQSMGWDGTFNGKQAPSDTYIYVMEVVCNNAQVVAIRGDVTLLR